MRPAPQAEDAMTGSLLPAEQLPVGVELPFGSHTVSAEEIVEYARMWDPQYFHTDAGASESSEYGGLIASGIHTLSIYQKLSVEAVLRTYDIVAGKELSRVRFLRPVRPGDSLTGSMVIDSLGAPRAGRRLATGSASLINQDDKTVLDLGIEFLVRSTAT
ncbi:MaoC family dehydratase [Brevibacterium salitolerans]|uniref:MaoC family dehydratase n=2 Tax=Brevibacteriaceae TaxID=85019 RepID=A0ABN2WTX3_9MICO